MASVISDEEEGRKNPYMRIPTHEIGEFMEHDGVRKIYETNSHLNSAILRQGTTQKISDHSRLKSDPIENMKIQEE